MMSNTWTLIEANETRIFLPKVLELHRRSYDATNQHGKAWWQFMVSSNKCGIFVQPLLLSPFFPAKVISSPTGCTCTTRKSLDDWLKWTTPNVTGELALYHFTMCFPPLCKPPHWKSLPSTVVCSKDNYIISKKQLLKYFFPNRLQASLYKTLTRILLVGAHAVGNS